MGEILFGLLNTPQPLLLDDRIALYKRIVFAITTIPENVARDCFTHDCFLSLLS
jgi:hypothetical protein